MKLNKITVTIGLLLLIVIGWNRTVAERNKTRAAYENYLGTAADYMKRGLYQKAGEEYKSAAKLKPSEEVYTGLLNACKAAYEENQRTYSTYLDAAREAATAYSGNADFAMQLAKLLVVKEDYSSACYYLKKAKERGASGEDFEQLLLEIRYIFDTDWRSYRNFRSAVNGFYEVYDEEGWTYLSDNGDETDFKKLSFAGPVGESGIRLIGEDNALRISDGKHVTQGILEGDAPTEVGVYSEKLFPARVDERVSYYGVMGDKVFGDYENAGSFTDGKAAVSDSEGWRLIDTTGKTVSEGSYEEIRLNPDGSWIKKGVMLAKQDGKYHLYNQKEKMIGDFSADDVDVITSDGVFAFMQDDKWGFADTKGNVLIAPEYEGAKSFSNQIAAVASDGKWGFIDMDNKLVIRYQFLSADYFSPSGLCMVETGQKLWQFIRRKVTE